MPKRLFTPEVDSVIADEYLNGKTSRELAVQYHCEKSAILGAIRRTGSHIGPSGKRAVNLDDAEVVRRYTAGEAVFAIGQSFGCSGHPVMRSLRRYGIEPEARISRGSRHPYWKGGAYIDHAGYRRVRLDKDDIDQFGSMRMVSGRGYVMEHRLVVAKALGRPLRKDESVHHLDGARLHNDISNLELRSGQHGKGCVAQCGQCGSRDIRFVVLGAPS